MEKISLPELSGRRRFPHAINNLFDANAETASIFIYDEIGGFGISADSVRRELANIDAPVINLSINSPGGDVFDGIAIYNELLSHDARVNVRVTGLAASAASIIAMAGDEISVAENGFLMIHNAWSMAIGNKRDMWDTGDVLNAIDKSLARTYSKRTGAEFEDISSMMDAETWLDAETAVNLKFADSIIESESANALFDLSIYSKVPDSLKRRIESGLRDVGFSQKQAKTAISQGFETLPARDEQGSARATSRDDSDALAAASQFLAKLNHSLEVKTNV